MKLRQRCLMIASIGCFNMTTSLWGGSYFWHLYGEPGVWWETPFEVSRFTLGFVLGLCLTMFAAMNFLCERDMQP